MNAERWSIACVHSMMFYEGAINFRYEGADRRRAIVRYARAGQAIVMGIPPEDVGIVGVGVAAP